MDHVIPRARGGSDDDSNLQPLCSFHHKQKTAQERRPQR
ncbi:MAG: HNH endonuclease [Nitrospira sp.]|nr:HNH endonuclease [Nitrospira sp.]